MVNRSGKPLWTGSRASLITIHYCNRPSSQKTSKYQTKPFFRSPKAYINLGKLIQSTASTIQSLRFTILWGHAVRKKIYVNFILAGVDFW